MSVLGFIESGAQIALQSLTIKPKRALITEDAKSITQIIKQVTLEEVHTDEMEITEHPVEQGTVIADHAFARPAEVIITAAWSNSPNATSTLGALGGFAAAQSGAARALVGALEFGSGLMNALGGLSSGQTNTQKTYDGILKLYRNRRLFDVYTGKRVYKNMMIRSLSTTTDRETENMLILRITCRQILMAATQTVTVPSSSTMSDPSKNAGVQDSGVTSPVPAPNINVTAIP